MVSYKKLYENLKANIESINTPTKTDYKCPLCGAVLLEDSSEFYCSNENCKFDKTFGELIYYYAEMNNLELRNEEDD